MKRVIIFRNGTDVNGKVVLYILVCIFYFIVLYFFISFLTDSASFFVSSENADFLTSEFVLYMSLKNYANVNMFNENHLSFNMHI